MPTGEFTSPNKFNYIFRRSQVIFAALHCRDKILLLRQPVNGDQSLEGTVINCYVFRGGEKWKHDTLLLFFFRLKHQLLESWGRKASHTPPIRKIRQVPNTWSFIFSGILKRCRKKLVAKKYRLKTQGAREAEAFFFWKVSILRARLTTSDSEFRLKINSHRLVIFLRKFSPPSIDFDGWLSLYTDN